MDRSTTNTTRLQELHPEFAARVQELLAYMEGEGYPLLITQGLRTWEEQDTLYAQGRTARGKIVTQARGGYSHHNFGLAVDLCPVFIPGAAEGTERIKADATLPMRRSATSVPAASSAVNPAGGLDWNLAHPAWKKLLVIAPSFGLAEGARWRSFPDTPHFYPVEIPSGTA
jgi:peptidoglycan L-alanyl-D-glutamate endopeptidase CwlK